MYKGNHRDAEASGRGGSGEGGRCGCRAEADGRAGLLQGMGERRADRGGVNVRRGATDPLRSGGTHPALSSPAATSAFGLGGYAPPVRARAGITSPMQAYR